MSDKDEKKGDKSNDFEKQYNDSQTHIATLETENKGFRETAQKDKELLDAVTPYIDWDAVNGTKPEVTSDGDGYVDQKTLAKTVEDLRGLINRSNTTNDFRAKFPDMVEYEDLVGVYLKKTDSRRPMDERIEKAVESTRNLLESERTKGRESGEQEKKDKVAKEAEASGLAAAKGQKGSEEEPDGESYDDYVKDRRALQSKNMGI